MSHSYIDPQIAAIRTDRVCRVVEAARRWGLSIYRMPGTEVVRIVGHRTDILAASIRHVAPEDLSPFKK